MSFEAQTSLSRRFPRSLSRMPHLDLTPTARFRAHHGERNFSLALQAPCYQAQDQVFPPSTTARPLNPLCLRDLFGVSTGPGKSSSSQRTESLLLLNCCRFARLALATKIFLIASQPETGLVLLISTHGAKLSQAASHW